MSKHVNTSFSHDSTIVFTHILLTFSVLLKNVIEMFIDVSKRMGGLRINSGLPTLENSFDKIGGDKLLVRNIYCTGV